MLHSDAETQKGTSIKLDAYDGVCFVRRVKHSLSDALSLSLSLPPSPALVIPSLSERMPEQRGLECDAGRRFPGGSNTLTSCVMSRNDAS